MRGEDGLSSRSRLSLGGSPPHARGRPPGVYRAGSRERITPACAGKTTFRGREVVLLADHPRMRGEDYGFVATTSSLKDHPRMRGEDFSV